MMNFTCLFFNRWKVLQLSLILLSSLCACQSPGGKGKLFTQLPASQTGVTFANTLDENERFNIIKYLYYYNGGGVATGDLDNDGLPDIYFTSNQGPDKLYLNKTSEGASSKGASIFKFEDITAQAGITENTGSGSTGRWKTGVSFADVNGDGWLDIYVCEVGFYKSINGRNRLFINSGKRPLAFTEQAAAYGLDFKGFSQQAAFFDYDLDGDLDMFLATHSVHSAESFVKAEKRLERDSMAGDVLFRNDGGKFTDVSGQAGIFGGKMGYGLGVVISDLNNDGWPDIYVTNDFHENDYLYLNNGNGTFTENITAATGHMSTFSMGVDAADCNNDGWPDLLTLDMKPEDETVLKASTGADHYNLYQMKLGYGYHYQFPRNMLQVSQSSVHSQQSAVRSQQSTVYPFGVSRKQQVAFSEMGQLSGVATTDWSWSALFADLDNDGWKDIFITNGIWRRPNDLDYLKFSSNAEVQRYATDLELAAKMPSGIVPNYAFRNRATGGQTPLFENVSAKWGLDLNGCSNGAAWADFDGDGSLDLVVNNLNAPAAIYRNEAHVFSKNNFLKIKLEGAGQNRFGIGAKVTLKAGGITQMQELSPVRGWQSSSDFVLNFGLGKATAIEELEVTWPGGKRQVLKNLPVNQTLVLKQTEAQTSPSPVAEPRATFLIPYPSPEIRHTENRFVDFNVEPLMPHKRSTQGPKIAVGDVNGDGLDDFYLCGAKAQAGQSAVLSPQSAVGSPQWAVRSPQPAFEEDFLCEDVDAVFFDADGDGDNDLFVVSGGGEYREGAPQLKDRLYLNDGKGNFSKSNALLPATNGGCAVAADFNGDGAIDLFIGSRSVPGSYGLTPESFIYLNDGKGNFRDATAEVCKEIKGAGMVTSAVWLPGERRLVVAGEWMPLTVFDFSKTPATAKTLPNSSGWWNALAAADMDGDGDLDIFAGNMGLNSNLTASEKEPMELYVKDFDGNLATEPIMAYYRQGKQYPVASKDELVSQLPMLKKGNVEYAAFARTTFSELFDKNLLDGAVRKQAQTFQSVYLENSGGGKFKMIPLPVEAQVAPIHAFLPGDFDGDGKTDVLAVGNFYDNQAYIGRYDASAGLFLKGDAKGNFTGLPPAVSGFFVPGEGRDIKLVKGADGKRLILAARNNDLMLVFEIGTH